MYIPADKKKSKSFEGYTLIVVRYSLLDIKISNKQFRIPSVLRQVRGELQSKTSLN